MKARYQKAFEMMIDNHEFRDTAGIFKSLYLKEFVKIAKREKILEFNINDMKNDYNWKRDSSRKDLNN
jgi:hypothetical protein